MFGVDLSEENLRKNFIDFEIHKHNPGFDYYDVFLLKRKLFLGLTINHKIKFQRNKSYKGDSVIWTESSEANHLRRKLNSIFRPQKPDYKSIIDVIESENFDGVYKFSHKEKVYTIVEEESLQSLIDDFKELEKFRDKVLFEEEEKTKEKIT